MTVLKTKQVLFVLLIYQLELNKQDFEIKAIAEFFCDQNCIL